MPDVSFTERVALEAMVARLADELRPYQGALQLHALVDPEEGDRALFEKRPLEQPGEVVVVADVSSSTSM